MRILRALCFILVFAPAVLCAQDMDLPIAPPRLTTGESDPEILESVNEDDGDDPRDTPPPVIYGEEIDTESDTIVFVLDKSFSMHNGQGWIIDLEGKKVYSTRLGKAKVELSRSISGLSENFKFNVVAYECVVSQLFSELQPANASNKSAALDWIRRLIADGGTTTGPATALGLSFRENTTVVLLTDGSPNCGADGTIGHLNMIIAANTQGARITVFAISPSRPRLRAFCMMIASTSGGNYIEIP